jgi:hypothetical protein
MLDEHPDIACVCESYLLIPAESAGLFNLEGDCWQKHGFEKDDVTRWRRQVENALTGTLRRDDMVCQNNARLNETLGSISHEALDDFARRCRAEVAGDKWPWYIDYLDFLDVEFPGAKIIYNVRDPRAVWHSAEKFNDKKRGDAVVLELISKDRRMETHLNRENVITLRYEDLLQDPTGVRKKLYRFLECRDDVSLDEYNADKDPYPNRWTWVPEASSKLNPRHGTKWKEKMPVKKIAWVESVAADFMSRYGYE